MRKLLLFLCLAMASTQTFAQNADSAYVRQNYTKMETYITMRDGIRLFTSIYMPKDQTNKYPILMEPLLDGRPLDAGITSAEVDSLQRVATRSIAGRR